MCACRATRCAHYDASLALVESRRCLVRLSECRDAPETACALPRVCLCEPCAEPDGAHRCGVVSQLFVTDAAARRPCESFLNATLPEPKTCTFEAHWWSTYLLQGVLFYVRSPFEALELPKRTWDALQVLW